MANEELRAEEAFNAKRDQYVEILRPLFLPPDPVSNDIIKYFACLLRVLGAEDAGWDPYAESRALLKDLNGFFSVELPEDRFPDAHATHWRIGLLMYGHVVEMDAPYEVLTNLLRFQLGHGYSPNPYFDFLSNDEQKKFRKRGVSVGRKIEIISELSKKLDYNIGKIFSEFYNNKLRNSVFHSDYILAKDFFYCRGGISGFRGFKIPYPELDNRIMCAKAFISSFFSLEQAAREIWGNRKHEAIPYDPHYKGLMEVLADNQGLMCGFRVLWPNDSVSSYSRTENGTDMVNCCLNIKDGTIDLFVGLYAQQPGDFSPLVERGAQPVYQPLDGSTERLTWPEYWELKRSM